MNGCIDLLIKSGGYTRKDSSILSSYREIRLFDLSASAGIGEFLDSDNFEITEVVPETDFGIQITVTVWRPVISTDRLWGYSKRKNWSPRRSTSFILMVCLLIYISLLWRIWYISVWREITWYYGWFGIYKGIV